MKTALAISAVGLVLALVALLAWRLGRSRRPAVARALFLKQRPELEKAFFEAAAQAGKPRGLRWVSCEFGDGLELARDKKSGELIGLLPVTIAFEAIPGSDMEGLPAVGNLRSATAVFGFRDGRWITDGRAAFNMNPAEALRHFANVYERVPETPGPASVKP